MFPPWVTFNNPSPSLSTTKSPSMSSKSKIRSSMEELSGIFHWQALKWCVQKVLVLIKTNLFDSTFMVARTFLLHNNENKIFRNVYFVAILNLKSYLPVIFSKYYICIEIGASLHVIYHHLLSAIRYPTF